MRRRSGSRVGGKRGQGRLRAIVLGLALSASVLAISAGSGTLAQVAPSPEAPVGLARGTDSSSPMLLEADQLTYVTDRDIVIASGHVEIHYNGYALTAERVRYERRSGRVFAEGSVRLVEPSGNLVTTDHIEVTQNFSEGFAASLQVQTVQRSRFAASSARRSGNITVFERGVYSACDTCAEVPTRPPTWRIRASRIVHDEGTHMVYYRGATFEFLGVPIAYLPYFSHPDPTVKRKTGFLTPVFDSSSKTGVGVKTPFFWNLAPNYDVTFSPAVYARQGFLADVEWRHRLISGAYTIRAAGLHQADRGAFAGTPGDEDWRGFIASKGDFRLNPWWSWGWDVTFPSDRTFLRDYGFRSGDVAISDIHLTGQSLRNRFDARGYYFRIMRDDDTGVDTQGKQPFVHPVIDSNFIFDQPVLGGELELTYNLTSLTRTDQDVQQKPGASGTDCTAAGVTNLSRCLFYGLKGNYTRSTLMASWRRQMIGPAGIVFTPFAYARGDAYFVDMRSPAPGVDIVDDSALWRGMPAIGFEARWPILVSGPSISQVIEPIVQMIARPSETKAGELPNEDAQSLVFDDTNLFSWDKFSGYDRIEGGTRLNAGLRYTALLPFGSVSAVVGQSFHLAGTNPYASTDLVSAGAGSGLETDRSDYVAGVQYQPNARLRFGARARFDESDFSLQRLETQGAAFFGRASGSLTYTYLRRQPEIDIPESRQEVVGALSLNATDNLRAFGALRYDIGNAALVGLGAGIAYDDDCFSVSLAYTKTRDDYTDLTEDQRIMLRVELRTLGDGQFSTGREETVSQTP